MPWATSWWAGYPVMSLPLKNTVPPAGFSSPLTARRVVVLPAPLAPIRQTILPAGTSKETSVMAAIWP